MWLFSAFSRTKQCENFRYTKDVPPASSFQVISNVSAASLEYLYAMCTADCFSHIECNAIDVCGTFCRLIRGWDSIYTEGNTSDQCQRYQVVSNSHQLFDCHKRWQIRGDKLSTYSLLFFCQECGQGEFYDRVSKTCVSHGQLQMIFNFFFSNSIFTANYKCRNIQVSLQNKVHK